MKYKVERVEHGIYRVMEFDYSNCGGTATTKFISLNPPSNCVYQGSLADCAAFISLHESGYMD